MVPSNAAPNVYEWAIPDHRAAGWLTRSASFAAAGNIVLAGHHNMAGEVFRDIWSLQPGDEITLWSGVEARLYQVTETLILPERDQPLEVRLANAQYIQPTADERLTLITCWPYEDNSHRAIVIARPVEGATP
jgi:sortase A